MPHFFKDKPFERLLGEGVVAEHLNDAALGRTLDAIFAYGPESTVRPTGRPSGKALGAILQSRAYRYQ